MKKSELALVVAALEANVERLIDWAQTQGYHDDRPPVQPDPPQPAQYAWADGVDLTDGLVTDGAGQTWPVTRMGKAMHGGQTIGAFRADSEDKKDRWYSLKYIRPVHPTASDVGRRVRVVSDAAWREKHHGYGAESTAWEIGTTGKITAVEATGHVCIDSGYRALAADLMLLADAPAPAEPDLRADVLAVLAPLYESGALTWKQHAAMIAALEVQHG